MAKSTPRERENASRRRRRRKTTMAVPSNYVPVESQQKKTWDVGEAQVSEQRQQENSSQ
jgi:hypothetical protein